MPRKTKTQNYQQLIERLLNLISPMNQPAARDYINVRTLDCRPPTLHSYAGILYHFDDHLNGQVGYRDASRDDVLAFRLSQRQRTCQSTDTMRTRQLKRFLKDIHGELPDGFVPVLRTKEPPPPDRANVLSTEQRDALLAACNRLWTPRWFDRVTMVQAFVWFLWDTGLRISEALSVRFCDVQIVGDMLRIKLNPQAPDLKTGPRTIEVSECLPAVRAWMDMHPDPAPTHFLWIIIKRESPPSAMAPDTADTLVKKLADLAGLSLQGDKPLSCHDFRHSSATRRSGWGEASLRVFHGWSRDSKMPARYVHKHLDDLRELVRRDAGLNENGARDVVEAGMKTCPTCAEDIKAAALKCRYCGEILKPLH